MYCVEQMNSKLPIEEKAKSLNINITDDMPNCDSLKKMESVLLQALINNMKIAEIDIATLKSVQKDSSQQTAQQSSKHPQQQSSSQQQAQGTSQSLLQSKLEEATSSETTDAATEASKTQSILQLVDKLIEAFDKKSSDKQAKNADYGNELAHIRQYRQLLEQYNRFLKAYLKENNKDGIDTGVKMQTYDDPFEKTDVVVPQRDFGRGQEIMTNSEIRDIVRRKRMNWLLGNEHNYVSPDEKERYHYWKMFSKFNYIMSEWCMFSL